MTDPTFGIVLRRTNIEPRPAVFADMSTVGIIGPAPDADPVAFPLNTPVKGYSNDIDWLDKLGADAGFLRDAIEGINAQLGELQRSAQIIVVRTPAGTGADAATRLAATIGNIMGSSTAGTGLWAFMKAPELVGAVPRIIVPPGYTSQLASAVDDTTYTTPGAGYTPGTELAITTTGGGTGAIQAYGRALVNAEGVPGEIVWDFPGAYFTEAPTVAIPAPPAGDGAVQAVATATIDSVYGNPVVSMLPAICTQLLAHAVVESAGISQTNDEDWRETFQSDRLIPVRGGVKVADPATGLPITRPFAPRVAGLLVRRDHETGGPFHSAANQPVFGILGPALVTPFAITHGDNEGQSLLRANIGILAMGEIGSDFAIASGGYVFVGTDNAGEDELWRFYNQTRGRDFIHLTLLRAMRYYLGRFNITGQTIQALLNTMDSVLGILVAEQSLLGARSDFVGSLNSVEEIRKGHVVVSFRAEEPAPIRKITVRSARYRDAVSAMVANLEAQLSLAA